MTEQDQKPAVPRISSMLARIKRPKVAAPFSRTENYVVAGMVLLFLLCLGCIQLVESAFLSMESARSLALPMIALIILLGAVFAVIQVIQVFQLVFNGGMDMADRIDANVDLDSVFVEELSRCEAEQLDRHSKLIDQEAKLRFRRAGLASGASTISALIINLLSSGSGNQALGWIDSAKLIITCCSLGMLIGSVMVMIFAGKLEKVSGLLRLAAEKSSLREDLTR